MCGEIVTTVTMVFTFSVKNTDIVTLSSQSTAMHKISFTLKE